MLQLLVKFQKNLQLTATTSNNKGNRADVCANDADDNLTLHQLESGDEDDGGIVDNSDDDGTDA